jgi:hypothetical protein
MKLSKSGLFQDKKAMMITKVRTMDTIKKDTIIITKKKTLFKILNIKIFN